MNRRVSHLIAGWRTGLSRPVLILQAGDALNYFGYGLVLPFEIIYLHHVRGFSTSMAGLVLAATMGTSAIVAPPTGALLDRYSAKALVVAGSLASALGYAGFAFVERPWQAFACSIVGGAGLGVAGTANRTLVVRLVTPEQRAAAFALDRVEDIEELEGAKPLCSRDDETSNGRASTDTEVARDAVKREGGRSLLRLDQPHDQCPIGRPCGAEPDSADN